MNFLTGYNFLTGFMTSYFCDVISSADLWRHIFVTSFPQRIFDVIFLWRHFLSGFMTSYFCDVISSADLGRHIFVTSFPQRICDVIFLWRHLWLARHDPRSDDEHMMLSHWYSTRVSLALSVGKRRRRMLLSWLQKEFLSNDARGQRQTKRSK
jgi:hypothetical protein